MKMNEAFPSRFINGLDLNGKDVTLTIGDVTCEDLVSRNSRGREETSTVYVVYFVGTKVNERGERRGLKLNATRNKILMELYGTESDNWVGKRITLYPENIQAFGDIHCVASVRKVVPPPAKPKTAKEQATEALAAPRKVVASSDELFPDEEDIEAYPVKPLATTPVQADAPLLEMALLPTTKQARSATNGSGLSCTITERIIPKWLGHIKSTARRCTWTPSQRIAVRSGRCASR